MVFKAFVALSKKACTYPTNAYHLPDHHHSRNHRLLTTHYLSSHTTVYARKLRGVSLPGRDLGRFLLKDNTRNGPLSLAGGLGCLAPSKGPVGILKLYRTLKSRFLLTCIRTAIIYNRAPMNFTTDLLAI